MRNDARRCLGVRTSARCGAVQHSGVRHLAKRCWGAPLVQRGPAWQCPRASPAECGAQLLLRAPALFGPEVLQVHRPLAPVDLRSLGTLAACRPPAPLAHTGTPCRHPCGSLPTPLGRQSVQALRCMHGAVPVLGAAVDPRKHDFLAFYVYRRRPNVSRPGRTSYLSCMVRQGLHGQRQYVVICGQCVAFPALRYPASELVRYGKAERTGPRSGTGTPSAL